MDGLFKSVLCRSVIGFALGLLAGAGILCLVPGAFTEGTAWPAICLISCPVYGAVAMGSTVVYDIERWSVARATLTHLLFTLGGLYLLGLAQGWLAFTLFGFFIPTAGFIAVYFLIWFVQWLTLRDKIRRVNRGMKEWKAMKNRTLENQ